MFKNYLLKLFPVFLYLFCFNSNCSEDENSRIHQDLRFEPEFTQEQTIQRPSMTNPRHRTLTLRSSQTGSDDLAFLSSPPPRTAMRSPSFSIADQEISRARERVSAPAGSREVSHNTLRGEFMNFYDDSDDDASLPSSAGDVEAIQRNIFSSESGLSQALSIVSSKYPMNPKVPIYKVTKKGTDKEFLLLGVHDGIPLKFLPTSIQSYLYHSDVFIFETPLANLDQILSVNQGEFPLSDRQIHEKVSEFHRWKSAWEETQPPLYNWFEKLSATYQSHLQTIFGRNSDFFQTIDIMNMPNQYAALHRSQGTIQGLTSYCRKNNKKIIPCFCTIEKSPPSLAQMIKSTLNIDAITLMTQDEWRLACKTSFHFLQILIKNSLASGGYFRREEMVRSMIAYLSGTPSDKKGYLLSLGKVERGPSTVWQEEVDKFIHTIEQNLGKKMLAGIDYNYLLDEGDSIGVLKILKTKGYKISELK